MARKRKKGRAVNGWLNVYKPADITSTQALNRVKSIMNPQKAGHAGTLDPMAEGVLPIALGEATKTIAFAQEAEKSYEFTVRWGEARDTDDREGEVIATSDVRPDHESINEQLPIFEGLIEQVPPKYSAIKIGGQRAYDMARSGEDFEIPVREVDIHRLSLISSDDKSAHFVCVCGKGTYIRALARDIAQYCGTYGYLDSLQRTKVGAFDIDSTITLDKLENMSHSPDLDEAVMPVDAVLDDIPAVDLQAQEARRLANGQQLKFIARPDTQRLIQAGIDISAAEPVTALALQDNQPLAIVEVEGVQIRPLRVLKLSS
jgi:tRNA pseudouridine55 synthase